MVTKTVSGNILLNTTVVGTFTISYEDGKEAKTVETKVTRSITITVSVGTVEVGSVTLFYEDLICSGSGGKRTITLTGNIEV
ncbi:MAG: hypothetical protein ACPL1Z_05795 [Candidatus Bathyarchaeales archaeon]